MTNPSMQRNPIKELAEDFLARYRRGERPSCEEYAQKYPKLADEIRDLFPALILMEEVGPAKEDSPRPGALDGPPRP
jgi:hypothetical protein